MYNYLHPNHINSFIAAALAEDVGSGDHTSLSTIPLSAQGKAQLIIKDTGILAGIELAKMIFAQVDSCLIVNQFLTDGTAIKPKDIALTVHGSSHSILKAERLVLNCMQRMSGIATYTHSMVQLLEGTNAKLLDTRKTTPNFRICEKWACKIGGAKNHRYALFDMILIKDNHVDYAGGITQALTQANAYITQNNLPLKIEIEVRNLDELQQVLDFETDVHRVMLDNFNYTNLKTAVAMVGNRYPTEASGGINETTIREYALCGVDYISCGALTHHVQSLDMSLKAF